jgi:hypothetical protein
LFGVVRLLFGLGYPVFPTLAAIFVPDIVGILSASIWLVAAVLILIRERYADSLRDFQCGALRWEARPIGYHASLADRYPPFALDGGPEPSSAAA